MLKLRPDQVSILSSDLIRRFEDRIAERFLAEWPEECSALGGAEELRKEIRHNTRRAMSHGITSMRDVARFLLCLLVLGSDSGDDSAYPWMSRILGEPSIPASVKVRLIYSRTLEDLSLRERRRPRREW